MTGLYHRQCDYCGASIKCANRTGPVYCEYCKREIQRLEDCRKSWMNYEPPRPKRRGVQVIRDPERTFPRNAIFTPDEHKDMLEHCYYIPGTILKRGDGMRLRVYECDGVQKAVIDA
jgi:predicted RNA-binding Zn-ribbon protein involved in translation (DUF1610 family)